MPDATDMRKYTDAAIFTNTSYCDAQLVPAKAPIAAYLKTIPSSDPPTQLSSRLR
jgi:hypothetical protein